MEQNDITITLTVADMKTVLAGLCSAMVDTEYKELRAEYRRLANMILDKLHEEERP